MDSLVIIVVLALLFYMTCIVAVGALWTLLSILIFMFYMIRLPFFYLSKKYTRFESIDKPFKRCLSFFSAVERFLYEHDYLVEIFEFSMETFEKRIAHE